MWVPLLAESKALWIMVHDAVISTKLFLDKLLLLRHLKKGERVC
jgi:hypothetical protein